MQNTKYVYFTMVRWDAVGLDDIHNFSNIHQMASWGVSSRIQYNYIYLIIDNRSLLIGKMK